MKASFLGNSLKLRRQLKDRIVAWSVITLLLKDLVSQIFLIVIVYKKVTQHIYITAFLHINTICILHGHLSRLTSHKQHAIIVKQFAFLSLTDHNIISMIINANKCMFISTNSPTLTELS